MLQRHQLLWGWVGLGWGLGFFFLRCSNSVKKKKWGWMGMGGGRAKILYFSFFKDQYFSKKFGSEEEFTGLKCTWPKLFQTKVYSYYWLLRLVLYQTSLLILLVIKQNKYLLAFVQVPHITSFRTCVCFANNWRRD